MIVTRKDLYDFSVTLTEDEFNDIKTITDFDNTPVEAVLANVIACGFDILRNGKDEKET